MTFFQTPPVLAHPFDEDQLLQTYLRRILPEDALEACRSELKALGDRVLNELEGLAQEAEASPPVHVPYDPWGRRVDQIKVSRAWERLNEIAAEEGIVATAYERKFGEFSRLFQFAKLYLFHPSSAIYSCPLAMSDGAARVIEVHGDKRLKERAFSFLTSRNPETFWTSGQWMTERTGGSDVSGTSTVARKQGDEYRLEGVKWFTSATTSQMAMTLARIEGDEKLSLFYVELRDEKGNLQNIEINRLKDKLGTKALPTAELTLKGTPATLVGERGKGVKTIATLFNITRVYNACCSVGYMRRGISLAIDYAKKREAFGKPLIAHDLHVQTLADLQTRFSAAFLMSFHSSLLLGKEEVGKASEEESKTLRLLIPLVKLYTAKEAVAVVSEVIEAFGGAGYVEDTGIPQLLRNTQVLSIWEGTTNVLSLDALRALKKEHAGEPFFRDLTGRLLKISRPELTPLKEEVSFSLKKVIGKLSEPWDEQKMSVEARNLAFNLSRLYCVGLLLEQAQWSLDEGDNKPFLLALRFIQRGLVENLETDEEYRNNSLKIIY